MSSKTVGNPTCGADVWAPPEISIFSGISYFIVAIIATPGNGLIILAVIIDPLKKLQTPFNYLLVNLAVADLIMGCIAMPMAVYLHYMEYKVKLEPLVNNIVRMLYFISGMASIISLIAMSVDRYIAISRAFTYRIFFTLKKCIAITIIIWSTSVAFPFLYFKIGAVSYYFVFACVAILTGFIVLVVVYFQIHKLLRRQTELMSSQLPPSSSKNLQLKRIRQDKRITRTYLIVLVWFMVLYLPGVVMVFVLNFWTTSDCVTRHVLRDLQSVLISFNSCVNPIIYLTRLKTFKKSVQRILCKFPRNSAQVAPAPVVEDKDEEDEGEGEEEVTTTNPTEDVPA